MRAHRRSRPRRPASWAVRKRVIRAGSFLTVVNRAKPLARVTPSLRFDVLEIRRLHGHERTRPSLLAELTEQIRADGILKRPILVADGDLVILDGHHRVEALRALGCKRVSAYLVHYESDNVTLDTWPDAVVKVVTKREVIRRG